MKAAACLWKVHGLEQRVAVIICAIRCLHLQLSCKWGRKKGEAAVLGLCLSLLAESLANEDFFSSLKKKITFLKHYHWKQGVDVSEGLWPLHPLSIHAVLLHGSMWQDLVLQLQPAALCSSTSKNVCPDFFCWCYCLSKHGRALASQHLLCHNWFFISSEH